MSGAKEYLRERLDEDLRKIHDHAQKSRDNPEDMEYLKIFCLLGIIQELREIHRTRADLEGL